MTSWPPASAALGRLGLAGFVSLVTASPDPVAASIFVAVTPRAAFATFTARFADWWPREYTWSGEALAEIRLGPGIGRLCSERGPHGFRCDWGRILVWRPPEQLALTWQVGPHREPIPDPNRATVVVVSFVADGDRGCSVEVVHHGFARHGPAGQNYRNVMASLHGWPYLLRRFSDATAR